MAISVNKVILVGRLGKDPERRGNNGNIVTFSLATSRSWKNRDGQREERTQWHNVVCYNEVKGNFAAEYLKKGDLVYIEGEIEYREYTDKDNVSRKATDIVIQKFNGDIQAHSERNGGNRDAGEGYTRPKRDPDSEGFSSGRPGTDAHKRYNPADVDDNIPF